MATSSRIGMEFRKEDGSLEIKSIYCHSGGYPEGVGSTLKNFYNTSEKMAALIGLGDISYLTESIECPEGHSFNTPIDGYTVTYYRDRGESFNQAVDESAAEYFKNSGQAYTYLFTEDGDLLISDGRKPK
jgi:hypothetical protein